MRNSGGQSQAGCYRFGREPRRKPFGVGDGERAGGEINKIVLCRSIPGSGLNVLPGTLLSALPLSSAAQGLAGSAVEHGHRREEQSAFRMMRESGEPPTTASRPYTLLMADSPPRDQMDRVAAQAAAFDEIGKRYDELFPHKEGQIDAGRWLIDCLPPGALVLDVGAGTGIPTARQLVDAGMEVLGIDISLVMLDLARANVPSARFLKANVLDLAPSLGPFDAAAAFFSLLMLSRAQIPVALTHLHSMVVPGGPLALSMVEADLDDVPIPFVGTTIRVSGYPRQQLRSLVEAAGFTVEEEKAFGYEPAGPGAPPEVQLFLYCRRAN